MQGVVYLLINLIYIIVDYVPLTMFTFEKIKEPIQNCKMIMLFVFITLYKYLQQFTTLKFMP